MKKFLHINSIAIALAIFSLIGFTMPALALAAGPAPVNLLSAGNFVILGETAITDANPTLSAIVGNVGVSPAAGSSMTGLSCSELTGNVYDVDGTYTGGYNSNITCLLAGPGANKTTVDNAVLDMGTAYTTAAGMTNPTATELGAGNIGGMTLAPGLYKWSTDVSIPTNLTLAGGPNDVWVFQIAGNLTIASGGSVPSGIKIILAGGAKSSNIFWQVGGVTGATLGTYSTFNGNILAAKQIIIQTGAVLNGKALSQTQVTLSGNTITSTNPAPTSAAFNLITSVSGGTALVSNFNLHIKNGAVEVAGSPTEGVVAPGTLYSLPAGTYAVSEEPKDSYTVSFSGDCNSSGSVTLSAGDDKTCTVSNTFVSPTPAPENGGGGFSSGGSSPIPNTTTTTVSSGGTPAPAPTSTSTPTPTTITTTTVTTNTTPTLPNTGFPPEQQNTPSNIFIIAGALILVSASVVLLKKSKV